MNRGVVRRGWIIFAQILGTIFTIFGAMYLIADVWSGLAIAKNAGIDPNSELAQEIIVNTFTRAVITSLSLYLIWKAVVTCYAIVGFLRKATDDDIINNKFIIIALSLNLGGVFTPFALSYLPNVASTSTISPKAYLSKVMGWIGLVGGIIALTTFLGVIIADENSIFINGALTLGGINIFDLNSNMGVASLIIVVGSVLLTVWSLITTIAFFNWKYEPTTNLNFQEEVEVQELSAGRKAIATVWMVIMTVELFGIAVMMLARLIGIFLDLARYMGFSGKNEKLNILVFILALPGIILTIIYTIAMIKITIQTMFGIWKRDGVTYKENITLTKWSKTSSQYNSATSYF